MEFNVLKAPKETGNLKERTPNYKKGYAFIPGWLLFDSSVPDEAKVTWAAIYKLIRNKRGEYIKINVSLDFIAELRGKSRRTIQRHLRNLKKTGKVFVQQYTYNKPCTITFHMIKDEKSQKSQG